MEVKTWVSIIKWINICAAYGLYSIAIQAVDWVSGNLRTGHLSSLQELRLPSDLEHLHSCLPNVWVWVPICLVCSA